jgi:YidC/Oxa1 family membrane protein insertase
MKPDSGMPNPTAIREVLVKEEHRILLAFLLITLIAVFFYTRPFKEPSAVPESSQNQEYLEEGPLAGDEKEAELKPPIQRNEGPVTPLPPSLFIGKGEVVVVDTDLYRIELSTRGGTIQSVKLKQYRGWELDSLKNTWEEKEQVELIPEGKRALGLSLGFESAYEGRKIEEIDLMDAFFEVDKKALSLFQPGEEGVVNFSLLLPTGQRVLKTFYFQEGSYLVGLDWESSSAERGTLTWGAGLRSTEKKETDLSDFASVVLMGGEFLRFARKEKKKELLNPIELESKSGQVSWAGVRNKYFLASIIPREGEIEGFSAQQLGLTNLAVSIFSRSASRVRYDIYIGPIDYEKLRNLEVGLERVVDMGWGWIRPISKGILYLLKFLYRSLPGHNYGVVIIIFSGLMMLIFFPLSLKSLRATRSMQKIQPKITQLREKHKKDPQRMNREMMALYKKNKVNPLGGCLPLVFQMPVFFGLYAVLRSTIELRGADFLMISDLSQPYPILAFIMGGTMIVQQRFTGVSQDPRQKMMMWMMPVFMTVIFINFPAGLVLYWLTYNILSITQHLLIRRREKVEEVSG